jgi:hypothetical protein
VPATKSRTTSRPFELHWGKGQIVEEAAYAGEHHEPSIQLLEFDDGYVAIRFCYYDHAGPFDYAQDRRFQRSPLIVNDSEMEGMRAALKRTPRLREMLRKLVG